MNQKAAIYRQGDVLLELVENIPTTAKRQRVKGPIILALGEATGHHHAFHKGKVRKYTEPGTQASYVEIAEAMAALQHQEHETVMVPPGKYRVTLQREYHPEEIRRVAD